MAQQRTLTQAEINAFTYNENFPFHTVQLKKNDTGSAYRSLGPYEKCQGPMVKWNTWNKYPRHEHEHKFPEEIIGSVGFYEGGTLRLQADFDHVPLETLPLVVNKSDPLVFARAHVHFGPTPTDKRISEPLYLTDAPKNIKYFANNMRAYAQQAHDKWLERNGREEEHYPS